MYQVNENQKNAVDQLVEAYSLNPVLFKTGAVHRLLCNLEDSHTAAKELAQLLNYQDFEWVDFDKCAGFCEKYNISPSAYWFLDKKPEQPETLAAFLKTLTVQEIKQLAKNKGIDKLPARKAEIIKKICAQTDLQDFKTDINDVLAEREEQYRQARFLAKCEALISDVYSRASAIGQMQRNASRPLAWKYSIFSPDESNDEREMAYLMMGGYHLAEDGQGGLKSLPPFFPGDSSWISAELDRSKRREIVLPEVATARPSQKTERKPEPISRKPAAVKSKTSSWLYIKLILSGFFLFSIFRPERDASGESVLAHFIFSMVFPFAVYFGVRFYRNKR